MRGTTATNDELTGNFGSAPEDTSINDYRMDTLLAEKSLQAIFGVLQHYLPKADQGGVGPPDPRWVESSSATSLARFAAARGRASRRRSRMRFPWAADAAPVSGKPAPNSLCSATHRCSAFSVAHRRPFRKSPSIFLSQSAATSGDKIGAQRSFLIASSS